MSKLLFSLRGVPDDEAAAVRRLLVQNKIEFYETPEGKLGISTGAIWLVDEGQRDVAEKLMNEFQQEYAAKSQNAYETAIQNGTGDSFFHKFMRQPLKFLLYIIAILFILYLTLSPFLTLAW